MKLEVTIEDIWARYESQNKKCALTGWDIPIEKERRRASLDRIDSSKGYTIDNIQWVDKDANESKWDYDQQLFIDMCHLVSSKPNKNLNPIEIKTWQRGSNYGGIGNLTLRHWNIISSSRYASGRKPKEFSLEMEYGWNLYVKQGGRCALSGMPIYFTLPGAAHADHQRQPGCNTASLDRIDSSKGYLINNVQWVHKDINSIKLDHPLERFMEMCQAISNTHQPSQNNESRLQPVKFDVPNLKAVEQHLQGARTGKYKGVSYHKMTGKYRARIRVGSKSIYLGVFINEIDAALAYDNCAKSVWKECYLNFSNEKSQS